MIKLSSLPCFVATSCALFSPLPAADVGFGEDRVFMGSTLLALPDGEVVAEEFLGKYPGSPHPVIGAENVFLQITGTSDVPFAPLGVVTDRASFRLTAASGSEPVEVLFPNSLWQKSLSALHRDMRRLITIENGNLFRSTLDWNSGALVDKQQLTQVGAFQYLNTAIWTSDAILFHGGFNETKPVVRVELASGEVTEHPAMGVFPERPRGWDRQLFANPSVTYLVRVVDPVVHILNLRTMTARAAPVEYPVISQLGNALYQSANLNWGRSGPVWVDDTRLFFSSVATGESGTIDVSTGATRWHSSTIEPIRVQSVLPGNRYADAVTFGVNPADIRRKTPPTGRVLVDLLTGEQTPIDLPPEAEVTWFSNRFAGFAVTSGGLSDVGYHVFDRTKNASIRLTALPVQEHTIAFNGKHALLCFSSHQQGAYIASLENGEVTRIGDDDRFNNFSPPVALGLSADAGDPWTQSPSEPLALAAPFELTGDAFGLRLVLETIEGESDEVRQAALDFYARTSRRSRGSSYYDPALATIEYIKLFKEAPGERGLERKIPWRNALSADHLRETFGAEVFRLQQRRMPLEEALQMSRWIGHWAANYVLREHPETGDVSSIVRTTKTLANKAYADHIEAGGSPDDLPGD